MKKIKKQNLKHILVTHDNFKKLRKLGYVNDTMNDVITKILKNKLSDSDEQPIQESDSDLK